ncbi:macrophage colony-stimulating factor 1 isoform X3 [Dermochelys coriacea]|uniref:macrophage colony-stimulating factor 1 isoform X3 n=1 Tax=Dermochelys coriacea TaxID=27794 RepID=UPI001CA8ED9B|nr:macrophage colony-stimulating factor 1 isoform X3 [Dermochelys coriacea]
MLRSGAIRGRAREKGRQETAAAPRPVPSRATSSQLPGAAAMAAQLRAEAAAPAARLGPKVRPVSCTLLTFFLLAACSIHETEQKGYCENIITKKHLDKLQELIDSQMLMSCHVSFEFIDEQQLGDPICFVKAAFPRLEDILDKMKFKKNSDNFNKTKDVQNMYKKIDENEVPCIDDQDDHERELSQACSKEFFMPPEKMLQLVKNFFHQVMVLLDKNVDFKRDCSKTYQKCSATKKEVPSPDQRRKEAQPKETQREVMSYVLVAVLATVAILLAVGGLLFYKHRSRTQNGRLQRRGNDLEEQEGRPLKGVEEPLELRVQGEL